ncbi:actin-histidine N-methyltransferase-like [Sycon ciliatum]|uniref:actin-histidine N-methyltransferase-like n=1 Tax=Sycon ciliatum TaxID=27933 RepID=UPI0031F69A29
MSRKRSRLQEKAQLSQELNRLAEKLGEACSVPASSPQQQWEGYLRVTSLIEELLRAQKPSHESAVRSEEETQKLHEDFGAWMKRNGADIKDVKISKVDVGDRGLIATRTLEAGDVAVTIPAKVMMSVHSALKTPLGRLIRSDALCKEMPNVVLALHLLNEKHKRDSFWKHYIHTLPETYHTPLYYSPEEMKLLQGTSGFSDAVSCVRNIAMQYSYLFRLIKNYPNLPLNVNTFTYDEYRWAVSSVMTRQNSVPLVGENDERQRSLALVPYWDLVNHRSGGAITTDFDDENDCLKCFSMWPCESGSQFMMYYGDRSSLDFLINSAFVPDENDHDRFKLKLGISKADKLVAKRSKVFESCGLPAHLSGMFTLTRPSRPLPVETTLFLRVFCMNEDELDRCATEQAKKEPLRLRQMLMDSTSPWSLSLHKRLWAFLNTRCELLLRQYPSSNEADDLIIDDPSSSFPTISIMKFRKSERRLLNEMIEFARHKLQLLEAE